MIDVHSHMYCFEGEEFIAVVKRFFDGGGKYIVNAATSIETSHLVISQNHEFKNVLPAIGLHPELTVPGTDIYQKNISSKWIIKNTQILANLIHDFPIVAVGECGLDYYWAKKNGIEDRSLIFELQKDLLKRQIVIASELELPIILHCRDQEGDKHAEAEMLELLKSYGSKSLRCLFHSYTGSLSYLSEIVSRGYFVSFNGILTYRNADNVRDILGKVLVDQILLETDCPWLVPNKAKSRGIIQNEPIFVDEVAEYAAQFLGISKEDLWKAVYSNFEKFMRIDI
ncbi:TatD family hydrolase [Candidatus Dojkabacteria bacterium]|nr:TatD family hydrolase [Candidatus Dojkabacteria bacterium]